MIIKYNGGGTSSYICRLVKGFDKGPCDIDGEGSVFENPGNAMVWGQMAPFSPDDSPNMTVGLNGGDGPVCQLTMIAQGPHQPHSSRIIPRSIRPSTNALSGPSNLHYILLFFRPGNPFIS